MDEEQKVCRMCGENFNSQEELDQHNREVHHMNNNGSETQTNQEENKQENSNNEPGKL